MKKLSQQLTYWLGVVAVGLVIGLSLQFVQAWTEPTVAPPAGNVGAPLNTSGTGQIKTGGVVLNTGGATIGLVVDQGNVGIGTITPNAGLKLDVEGKVGATEYCDQSGNNCVAAGSLSGGAPILTFYTLKGGETKLVKHDICTYNGGRILYPGPVVSKRIYVEMNNSTTIPPTWRLSVVGAYTESDEIYFMCMDW